MRNALRPIHSVKPRHSLSGAILIQITIGTSPSFLDCEFAQPTNLIVVANKLISAVKFRRRKSSTQVRNKLCRRPPGFVLILQPHQYKDAN